MSPAELALARQLSYQRFLNLRLARARERMLRTPSPFFVREFLEALHNANLFADALVIYQVPTAHCEALHQLLTTSHIPVAAH